MLNPVKFFTKFLSKIMMYEFKIKTKKREEILDITDRIRGIVENLDGDIKRKAKAGLVYVPHTTCSVIINENYDKAVCSDILEFLRKSIPKGIWKHDGVDNNGDSHVKSAILGVSQIIPLDKGKLVLGTWQNISLAEFDGPRERKVIVEILR